MKEKILSAVVNLVALGIAMLLALGGFHIWNSIKFQRAYNENVISVQRGQIEQTCKTLAEESEKAEEESEK